MHRRAHKGASQVTTALGATCCVLLVHLSLSGCGEGAIIGAPRSPDSGGWPRAEDQGPVLGHDDGQVPDPVVKPEPDSGASPAGDSLVQDNGCPDPAQLAGSYVGSFVGTIDAVIPIGLQGTLGFTLVPSGADLTLQDGTVSGELAGVSYALPMTGTVSCGQLKGEGTGTLAGVQFSGKYLAAWTAGTFKAGTWNGQDSGSSTPASGTWSASRQ